MARVNVKQYLRQICLAYHQRGIEKTWQEVKKEVDRLREKHGLGLLEALEVVEDSAVRAKTEDDN